MDADSAGCRPNGAEADRERECALGLTHMLAHHGFPIALPTGDYSPSEIWRSSDTRFRRLVKASEKALDGLLDFRRGYDAGRSRRQLERSGIAMVALCESQYPDCLRQMHDPPPALFLKSSRLESLADLLSRRRIAIVGARGPSRYGIDAATSLAADLSAAGVSVISGLAYGIDAAAHRGSLAVAATRHDARSPDGRAGAGNGDSPPAGAESAPLTAAVLGCGCDVVYPRGNARLYRQIVESGLIISEYPPATRPRPWRFPARNRIIAGLCEGVVVVEAREKSGALITADFCLEQGKLIWAVPGEIFSPLSAGPHLLLRSGAAPVTSADDMLDDMGIENSTAEGRTGARCPTSPVRRDSYADAELSDHERQVLAVLGRRPAAIDNLARLSGLDGGRAAAALVSLELKGLARHDATQGYSL